MSCSVIFFSSSNFPSIHCKATIESTIHKLLIRQQEKLLEGFKVWWPLRVCLFGGEIGWIKNFGEKMRRNFLKSVWLRGGERKIMVGHSRTHQKVFSNMKRKLVGRKSYKWRTKMPTSKLHMGFFYSFFIFYLFFIFIF